MASGKLGSASLTLNTDTLMYTVPTGKLASLNITICNRGVTSSKVRIAVGVGASPIDSDYLEYDSIVPGNGILERTAIVCSENEKIWVRSDLSTVTARVHGFEEIA